MDNYETFSTYLYTYVVDSCLFTGVHTCSSLKLHNYVLQKVSISESEWKMRVFSKTKANLTIHIVNSY